MITLNGVLIAIASYCLYRERISGVQILGIAIILVSFGFIVINSHPASLLFPF